MALSVLSVDLMMLTLESSSLKKAVLSCSAVVIVATASSVSSLELFSVAKDWSKSSL